MRDRDRVFRYAFLSSPIFTLYSPIAGLSQAYRALEIHMKSLNQTSSLLFDISPPVHNL
jgi:hypothetical protein